MLARAQKLFSLSRRIQSTRQSHPANTLRQNNLYSTKRAIILGIETSCDDTAAAIVTSNKETLSHVIEHQDHLHAQYRGVYPRIAQEAHEKNIDKVIENAMEQAKLKYTDLTAVAFTYGPGLPFSLSVGIKKAKQLHFDYKLPLIPVNHMAGHALIARLTEERQVNFPFLTLLISGGHTQLVVCRSAEDFSLLGTSMDDAIGEAYDKVYTRTLFPEYQIASAGRELEELAAKGNTERFIFKVPLEKTKNCNFSFSGLKTAVQTVASNLPELTLQDKADLAACFQQVAIKHLIQKTMTAIHWCRKNEPNVRDFVVSGGSAANNAIRGALTKLAGQYKLNISFPPPKLCTDNGVMIAWAGMEKYLANIPLLTDAKEIEEFKYVPKLQLDASGKFYFAPNPKKMRLNTNLANEVLSSSLEKIKKGEANEKWHYKAAQSAFALGKYEDSDRLLKEGLAKYPKSSKLKSVQTKLRLLKELNSKPK
jgi:N6-L-threonylcarbamoyladenine synthase